MAAAAAAAEETAAAAASSKEGRNEDVGGVGGSLGRMQNVLPLSVTDTGKELSRCGAGRSGSASALEHLRSEDSVGSREEKISHGSTKEGGFSEQKQKISFLSSICASIFGGSRTNSSGNTQIEQPSSSTRWANGRFSISRKSSLQRKRSLFVLEVTNNDMGPTRGLDLELHRFDDVGRIANRYQGDKWDAW